MVKIAVDLSIRFQCEILILIMSNLFSNFFVFHVNRLEFRFTLKGGGDVNVCVRVSLCDCFVYVSEWQLNVLLSVRVKITCVYLTVLYMCVRVYSTRFHFFSLYLCQYICVYMLEFGFVNFYLYMLDLSSFHNE